MNDTRTLLRIAAAILTLVAIAPGCSSAPRSDESTTSSADDDLRKKDPCAPCSDSCSRCTDQPGCGWDHIHGKCRSGDVYGPNPRKPGDESLDWITGTWTTTEDTCKVPAANPDPHAACAATNCRECADLPDCGWYMPSDGPARCVAGTSPQPFVHEWPFDSDVNWIYNPSACFMRDATTLLPPGPTCQGTSGSTPPPSGGGSDGSGGEGSDGSDGGSTTPPKGPYLDWTCDVTEVKDGVTVHTTETLCSWADDVDTEANYYACTEGDHNGVSSCSVSGCVSHGCCWNGCDR